MPAAGIQFEIEQLRGVGTRLTALADKHPRVEGEIISVSGNVLRNAMILELLLATRIKSI